MRTATRRSVAALLLATSVATSGACAKSDAEAVVGKDIKSMDAKFLPPDVLGLKVAAEDATAVNRSKTSFVDGVGLYSLRKDELLQATLQVSRFSADADVEKSDFRRAVVQQIGNSIPRAYRMGGETVYLTSARRQVVAVWFKGRHLFVLSTREEYGSARSLLRQLLEVKP